MALRVIETVADLVADPPVDGTRRVVVMTMGALHDGHSVLLDAARALAGPQGQVVATIFVNPTQFAPDEDYSRYPRTWPEDLARCEAAGVDIVFAPTAADMYPFDSGITVDPGPLGTVLEGAVRPGHFRGMLTVVLKLLHLVAPTDALFGEKDYQQLVLIRHMVEALNVPVQIHAAATVRDPDGLAQSSRNSYLTEPERAAAAVIPRATAAAVEAAAAGAAAATVVQTAEAVLAQEPLALVDYVAVTDPALGPPPADGPARLLLAVRIGAPRLLDNVALTLRAPA